MRALWFLVLLAACSAPQETRTAAREPTATVEDELPRLEPALRGPNARPLGAGWGRRHEVHLPAARRAIRAIAALGARYPALDGALHHAMIVTEGPAVFARWAHASGTHLVPNPAWDPRRPESPIPRQLEKLAPNGLRVDLTFFEGPWSGLDAFVPIPFGELSVRLLVESPDGATRAAVEEQVRSILSAEAPRGR